MSFVYILILCEESTMKKLLFVLAIAFGVSATYSSSFAYNNCGPFVTAKECRN